MKKIILLTCLIICTSFLNFNNLKAQTFDNTTVNMCNVPPGCQQPPICTLFDDCFRFDYYGATDMGNGKSVLKFKITNFSESTFKQATFELPGNGAATAPASRPLTRFRNRFNHSVVNPYQDSLILFNALNAGLFSYGGFEMYYYEVNTADLLAPSGRKAQITARAGRTWQPIRTGTVNFDFDVCQGQCPPPTANLFLFPPGNLCLNNATPYVISATPQPNSTYNWTIVNGTIASGNGTNSITIIPDSVAGTLRVNLKVTNQCSFAIASKLFNVIDCNQQCPTTVDEECVKEDCCFNYALEGADIGADIGFFRPAFTLTKLCTRDVISVSFSTNGATASGAMATERTWTVTQNPDLVTFTNPNSPWTNTAPDNLESFFYQIPESSVTGPGATGRFVTITITTGSGILTQTFDLLNNGPCGIRPLPVELISFKGNSTPEGIVLKWETASEQNNDRFEIERSTNGKNFEKIGMVKGHGTTSNRNSYSFLDARPTHELLYYRLKQVDTDGTHANSKIVLVRTDGTRTEPLGIAMAPNPCPDRNCSVMLTGLETAKAVTVTIKDLTGRTVFSKELPKDQVNFSLPKLDAGSGVYILSVTNGNSTAYQKVIIQQ